MVEYAIQLDDIFGSLADPIRRDILTQVARVELSVGELVQKYDVSFAAISKHLKVLEKAHLITKRKEGKKHMIALAPQALQEAGAYLDQYEQLLRARFDRLEILLTKGL